MVVPSPPDPLRAFVRLAVDQGVLVQGHHHRNHITPLPPRPAALLGRDPGESVTVRIPRADALPVVIRTWPDETAVLTAVREVLPGVPRSLARWDGGTVQTHVAGVTLNELCPDGKPVDRILVEALAGRLARLTQVRRSALPPLPVTWPRNGTDTRAFLRTLAHRADVQIRQANWTEFGGLFTALGLPEDALREWGERTPALTRRPFSLLHADLHRDNVIVSEGPDGPRLTCVDWELASYGDPLHDLATHLVRMRYPDAQWPEVIEAWAAAVREVRPAAGHGLSRDLPHYLAFERAQSVYPDVMRAARSLARSFTQERLTAATEAVRRALDTAAQPLRLARVAGDGEIERALFRWCASRDGGGPRPLAGAHRWSRDRRVPERADFPDAAVRQALREEGAAPAHRVFKGTGHLNTVVWVPGAGTPVVVRRKLPQDCRRERSFLSEHSVLRAIERANVRVAAPRVLALGESGSRDPFAIHTYVGPADVDRTPRHPVDGLLPHEADGLVDQLCALTRVHYRQLDPVAGGGGFYGWLVEQLVALVAELPAESLRRARLLGLPDADRLRRILSRQPPTERKPSLLHGDLNPWNLVRRDDDLALTIIDWEMAVVGDPLYDLVRHLHLTPTRPEIRARMFRRWERGLPPEHTRDWRQDWRAYRRLEAVRSAYIDLDRLVTGASLDAPNVRRAIDSYAGTLAVATGALGLPVRRLSAGMRERLRTLAP
ncbi:aminoglycoside phosphotransferase family protein [Streptomyces sp. NPDC023723]|uniref:phosphotransferase family protein n=1 Tax=Streptomyces sp. NPDC023723 TaxID=3154323 RepID=UPI00340CF70D